MSKEMYQACVCDQQFPKTNRSTNDVARQYTSGAAQVLLLFQVFSGRHWTSGAIGCLRLTKYRPVKIHTWKTYPYEKSEDVRYIFSISYMGITMMNTPYLVKGPPKVLVVPVWYIEADDIRSVGCKLKYNVHVYIYILHWLYIIFEMNVPSSGRAHNAIQRLDTYRTSRAVG